MSARLGIEPGRAFGGVRPDGKVAVIRELQAGGTAVAMAGEASVTAPGAP